VIKQFLTNSAVIMQLVTAGRPPSDAGLRTLIAGTDPAVMDYMITSV
jgi:hypothetical protein